MITSKDQVQMYRESPYTPEDWQPGEGDIAEFKRAAKESNESIWGAPCSTLKEILGDQPGTRAKTYNGEKDYWSYVEQHKNQHGDLYWIYYDDEYGNPPIKQHDFSGKNIAFYYEVDEPIWIAA
jgi:hypothetical protein